MKERKIKRCPPFLKLCTQYLWTIGTKTKMASLLSTFSESKVNFSKSLNYLVFHILKYLKFPTSTYESIFVIHT